MSNRLSASRSPYLLQHAGNPVDWYPWGDEPFERARSEDKPVLVSIGYSACHWCHVMAHESFENAAVARLMNDNFVNIKVDREERPDVDTVYMEAVQMMTGQGGWPLNIFMTPDRKPFFGGTYWPPSPRHGLPSWPQVLQSIALAWRNERSRIDNSATSLLESIHQSNRIEQSANPLTRSILDQAYETARSHFDRTNGGFGGPPKFPQPMSLEFLLRTFARTGNREPLDMVCLTLDRMAGGGIHDQLGGGFHRYSVDGSWTVPHFEKMLYDNAQLSRLYIEAWQVTKQQNYRDVAGGILEYVLRDMTSPEGGFYSSEDADSEGEEGTYYVWTPEEVEALLSPEENAVFRRRFGVTSNGNFEGKTILTSPATVAAVAADSGSSVGNVEELLEAGRQKLLAARAKRPRPGRDQKILTDWNAIMLRSLAMAGPAFGRPEYLRAAEKNAAFILDGLQRDGRLSHVVNDAPAGTPGYVEDYAFLVDGLTVLFEATGAARWLDAARTLADTMVKLFADPAGGFFTTPVDAERDLPIRPKTLVDGVIPSGNSAAAIALMRLAALTGDERLEAPALATIRLVSAALGPHPLSFGNMLAALDFHLAPKREIVIIGCAGAADTRALQEVVSTSFQPNAVGVVATPDGVTQLGIPLTQGRATTDGKATAFVCSASVCDTPVTDPLALARQLSPSTPT